MPVFVYYSDDHFEMGGVGLQEFVSREEAAQFILERSKLNRADPHKNYTVIEGTKLTAKIVEVATKIDLMEDG